MKRMLLVISCIFLIAGCDKKIDVEIVDNFEDVKVELRDQEVEINNDLLNTAGIVNVEHGEVLTEEVNVDTSKLGEQEVTIVVKNERDEEKEFSYKVNVIDTTKPVISAKDKITTTEGTKVNLTKNVTVKDNSKEKLEVKVEGKYDLNKVGTYKLQYVVKDSSGNETTKDFTLVVKEKVVEEKKEVTTSEKKTTTTPKTTTTSGYNPNGTPSSFNGTKTSKGYTIVVKNGITYIDGIMIANKTYSLPKSYNPGGLTSVTKSAINEMLAAAKKDGLSLYIASGYRSFATQNNLWQKRAKNYGKAFADSGTARGGYSEHQTGLAADICGEGKGCISSDYHNSKGAKWMAANAYKYGLILRYPKGKDGITGYKYESWHFRYVGKDLAKKLYNGGNWITLEEHFGITSKYAE